MFLAILLVTMTACATQQPVSTANNDSGNQQQTTIVIEGDNAGEITVNQGIVETDNAQSMPLVATEVPAATETTEAPAAEADSDVCFYTAWHDGWQDGPERMNTTGVISRVALEKGISMQASWDKLTSTEKVDGFTIPKGFEANNDAVHGISCGDTAYMLGRTPESEMPFWFSSFFQLTPQGLLACKNDTGNPGSSIGTCDKNAAYVVITGIPLEDVFVSDFQTNWDSLLELRESWDGVTPEFISIEEAWTSKK